MKSVRYYMPIGNPTLFSSLATNEAVLICDVCHQEKPRALFYHRANRIGTRPYADHGNICTKCADLGKHCSACGVYKRFAEFPKGSNRGQTHAYCLLCKRTRNNADYAKHGRSDARKSRVKNYHLHIKFGISKEQYDVMFEAQHGLCASCGKSETRTEKKTGAISRLAVDHHHESGVVRGLLCYGCNTAFGHLREDHERIASLLAYAQRWQL